MHGGVGSTWKQAKIMRIGSNGETAGGCWESARRIGTSNSVYLGWQGKPPWATSIASLVKWKTLWWGGHIGYSIPDPGTRQGYGQEQLHLGLIEAKRAGFGLYSDYLRQKTEAGRRTILANGGVSRQPFRKQKPYWTEARWRSGMNNPKPQEWKNGASEGRIIDYKGFLTLCGWRRCHNSLYVSGCMFHCEAAIIQQPGASTLVFPIPRAGRTSQDWRNPMCRADHLGGLSLFSAWAFSCPWSSGFGESFRQEYLVLDGYAQEEMMETEDKLELLEVPIDILVDGRFDLTRRILFTVSLALPISAL